MPWRTMPLAPVAIAFAFRNPGTFDYAERLKQEDIHVTAATRADRLTRVDDFAPPWPARIKRASLAAISQALPPTSAALLTGLLLGERTALPSELDEGFRRAGVYHVLAVSGFNVALLAGATLALCRLARIGRRPSAVAAIVVVVGFAFRSAGAAQVAFDAVWPLLLALRAVVALAATVPGALVHLPAPHGVASACYAGALALGLVWWRCRVERPRVGGPSGAAALLLLALAAAVAAWPLLRPPDGRLRVIVLDVGQGDAIVVEAPDGRVLLVDSGAGGPMRLDAGAHVVAPFLWNRGHLWLAGAIVTHQDADHAGGMASIGRRFDIGPGVDAETLARGPVWIGGAMLSLLDARATDRAGDRGPSETRSFWALPGATHETLPQRDRVVAWSRRGADPRSEERRVGKEW